MLKQIILPAALVIAIALTGCAKRNTAYQADEVLTLLSQIPVVGEPSDIAIDGTDIYVALDQGGLAIIDAADYTMRWFTKLLPEGSDSQLVNSRGISVVGEHDLLFLGEYVASDKIRIVDISDPDSLKLIDSITGGTDGLQALNFKALPTQIGDNIIEGFFSAGRNLNYCRYNGELYLGTEYVINTPATASGLDSSDNHLFVAAEQRGLLIYDRSNQQMVSELAVPGQALDVKIAGNYAYVASRQGGLNVVDISNPANPSLVWSFDTTGYATKIELNASYAALSSGGGGIYLFDISVPSHPVLKQQLLSAGYTKNVKFLDDKLIVASRDQGVLVYAID